MWKSLPQFGLSTLLICGLSACAKPIDKTDEASSIRPIIAAYVDAYNQCDLAAATKLMHPDIEWLSIEGSDVTSVTNGRDQLVSELESYMAGGCATQSQLSDWSVNGRMTAVTETAMWTKLDGSAASQSSTAIYEIESDTVRRVWYFPAQK